MALPKSARRELARICGADAVHTDATHRLVYAKDAYALDGLPPDAVVLPSTAEQVRQVVRWCVRHGVPYVARGAGTGLSGGCLTLDGGVQIGTARLRRILEIDPLERVAVVEPGVVNLELSRVAAAHGLHFAPDPSSQAACTVGGNLAENSGGPHTLKQGVTLPHVLGVTLVDGEGEWARYGGRCEIAGPDLLALLVGAEGTTGIVTELTLRLMPLPEAVRTFLVVYPELSDAARSVSALIAAGIVPAAMELIDQVMLRAVEAAFHFGFPLDAGAVLIVELDGAAAELERAAPAVRSICGKGASELREASSERERAALWRARKHAFGAIGRMAPNYATQDGVVPRACVPEIVQHIRNVAERHGIGIGTVIHAGDGNIHPCILFDESQPEQVERALRAGSEILLRCIELGGSPTGEHGIGLEKREFLSLVFGPDELAAMADLRRAFEPRGLCNPGKVLPGAGGCSELRVAGRQVSA